MIRDHNEDGWMLLANAIMESYAEEYASMFPKDAASQDEYTAKDLLYYQRRRESILNSVTHGPLRHMADRGVCKAGFDAMREQSKLQAGVPWNG